MLEPCPGCGVFFAPSAGNFTHAYIGASASGWALYTALVAGQTPDADLIARSQIDAGRTAAPALPNMAVLPGVESLLVDGYAAQQHGEPSPQAIQSVAVHLLRLRGVLECNVDPVLRRHPDRRVHALRAGRLNARLE